MEIFNAKEYKKEVESLLISQNLPVADLPEELNTFIVALDRGVVVAVAGYEVYGKYILLRSVAVAPEYRSKGIAAALVSKTETMCSQQNSEAVYLLTETAADYFKNKGYNVVSRADVPADVQASSEFRYVCPSSATAMKKNLKS